MSPEANSQSFKFVILHLAHSIRPAKFGFGLIFDQFMSQYPLIRSNELKLGFCLIAIFFGIGLYGQTRSCEVGQYYQDKSQAYLPLPLSRPLESRANPKLNIVFHVVWNTPSENVPMAQIVKQIERLNLDFNNSNTSRSAVPVEFRDRIGNPGVEFCLANKDPNGNPHDGVNRIQTSVRNVGSTRDAFGRYVIHYSNTMGQTGWDPNRFINVWVGKMENIFGRSTIGGTAYPLAEDGIVIDPEQFGVDFNRSLFGRTLVHEMGHYLGLQHLWGAALGDCSEDDGIADTPVQDGPYYGCPAYPTRSCGNNNMFMNFMDYVDDFCMQLFTEGQAITMLKTLNDFRPGLLTQDASCGPDTGPVALSGINYLWNASASMLTLQLNHIPDRLLYVEVSNVLGQRVYRNQWDRTTTHEINTNNWIAGIYLVNLRYNKEKRTIKLFIH